MLRFLRPSPVDQELAEALQRFTGAFQLVFQDDWSYSREMLAHDIDYAVPRGATFVEPGPSHVNRNWGARTALLKAHAELLAAMRARGMAPEVPQQDPYFNFGWSTSGGRQPK